jgi:hypothetical protein
MGAMRSPEVRMTRRQVEQYHARASADVHASMQKGAKPIRYWTTILGDDPDNRDLNQISDQMIAAGAELFNRKTEREEAEISTGIRNSRVIVGTSRVIPDEPKK